MSRARLLAAAFGADGTLNTSDVAGLSTVAVSGQYTDLLGKPVLSTVATSGLFADLLSKPTTVAGYGITDALTGITSGQVTTALGYTPYNSTNPSGYISSINSSMVTTALGYTPYNSSNPSGYISGNQTITVSGDATGSGATSIALTLANSGVTAGTYTKITVDAKGRVTTGASLASGDLPTYTGTITSSQVTTALGYTPYNSSNPSGYITSSALSSYLPLSGGTLSGGLTGTSAAFTSVTDNTYRVMSAVAMDIPRNIGASTNLDTDLESGGAFSSYGAGGTSWNAPFGYGGVIGLAFGSGIRAQLGFDIRHGNTNYGDLWYRTKNASGYSTWRTMLHSGNYNSYALPLTGGTISGTLSVSSAYGTMAAVKGSGFGYAPGSYGAIVLGSTAAYQTTCIGVDPVANASGSFSGLGHEVLFRNGVVFSSPNSSNNGYHAYVTLSNGVANFTATLQNSGSQVLNASNYNSYALPLSGGSLTGTLNIGTSANISFGSQTRQMLNLWATSYGIGVQSSTLYFRTSGIFAWHRGGVHSDSEAAPGSGGALAMHLDSSSNLTAYGNVTAYSDERVKANWRKLEDGFLVRLSSVKSGIYDRTDAEVTQVGVSAQSLREVLPHAVIESDAGDLSVAYGNAALVAAVELAKEVVALKREIEALKSRLH